MEIRHKIENKRGSFFIELEGCKVAELDYEIKANVLCAYHTGVRPKLEGQGIANKLFNELINYARANNYMINPSCPYILAKLKHNSDKFADIWCRSNDDPTGDASKI